MGETMDQATANDGGGSDWPPAGWVTNREAARMLGVSLNSMVCHAWKWYASLHKHARCVRIPGTGGRCNIYALAGIQEIIAARDEASRPKIPEGFVDKEGAARMFGLSRAGWKSWVRLGKVRCGQTNSLGGGPKRKIYAIADLERMREELFGEDKLFKRGSSAYHVPAGLVRREEAWEKFGVGKHTWERWEREGLITCGERIPGGPKLYKVEDIERLLEEYGRFSPPYPDPDRPGVYRVPLSGRGIKRREALIDAETLPLIEAGSCHLGNVGEEMFVSYWCGDGRHTPLRRLIMGVDGTRLNVRHINGDPLDCRRENLVVRTVRQRCRNARKIKAVRGQACSSRFKGVYWDQRMKRWYAKIKFERKTRTLGHFRDEIAAALAYDEAARLWFGEHAHLNFPDGVDARLEAEAEQERMRIDAAQAPAAEAA